jgi:hypothetical protein
MSMELATGPRTRWQTLSVLMLGTLLLAGCGSRVLMRQDTQEYRSEAVDARHIERLVIVPAEANQHDARVAARAHDVLGQENWPALLRRVATSDHATATRNVCAARELNGEVHGVIFVTWDRLTLRACAAPAEVAYEVQGAYAGIDTMTRRLIAYLRGAATPPVD